jgi:Transposase DDE domain
MPPRILPILDRLRQDHSDLLAPAAIEDACRQEGYTWRKRLLDPVVTIYLFLLQVLHGNTACQHVVPFGCRTFSDSAYCQARKRLPLRVFYRLLEWITRAGRRATAKDHRWFGHRVWVLDGSSSSMPDTAELQAAFGQPGNQRPGCGFPVAKWLALFDVGTGMLLRSSTAPLRSHEMSRCAAISEGAEPGDIVMGDRGLSSYAHLAILVGRGLHGLFRLHQRRAVDAPPVGPRAGAREFDSPAGLPGSRWSPARGESDQVVVWDKPKRKPTWMSAEEYAAPPAELVVRVVRYRVESPGFRVGEVAVVTTLLGAPAYPAEEVATLYFRRWLVEVNFKHIKTTMKMDVLRCETVHGVLKELAMFALVYNLIRSVTAESARAQGVAPERISVIDTIRWLIGSEDAGDVTVLVVNPVRPGRVEPRVVKRRPKQYYRMTKPRSELRKKLPMKGF